MVALAVYLTNVALFSNYFSLDQQSYYDADLGLRQYDDLARAVGLNLTISASDAFEIRIAQTVVTLLLLFFLFAAGQLSLQRISLFLIWPHAAYTASKVKQEFILFPLAFIDLNTSARREAGICLFILLLSVILKENNGFIILAFRILAFFYFRISMRKAIFFTIVGIGLCWFADSQFDLLRGFFPPLERFRWTREVENPEYSVIESFGVLVTSFHLGVTPKTDWVYEIPIAVTLLAIAFRMVKKLPREERTRTWKASLAAVVVFQLFTSITHSFQDSRYYFFVVPIAFPKTPARLFVFLVGMSLLNTVITVYLYEFMHWGLHHDERRWG